MKHINLKTACLRMHIEIATHMVQNKLGHKTSGNASKISQNMSSKLARKEN
jgi:hypothetical protein